MFFTITSVENVVIDIDSLEGEQSLFDSIISLLESKKFRFALVSDKSSTTLSIDGLEIFRPESYEESALFQNVIRRAVRSLNGKTTKTVFLAADGSKLQAACELLLGTVVIKKSGLTEQERRTLRRDFSDFFVDSVEALEKALTGECIGYGGEYCAAINCTVFQGSPIKDFRYPRILNEDYPDCAGYVTGRYFDTIDPRYSLHPLSVRIVSSKNKPDLQADFIAQTLAHAIYWTHNLEFNYITWIPPRPEETDRLAIFLNQLPNTKRLKDISDISAKVKPGLLKCIKKYPPLKKLTALQRKAALEGAFESTLSLINKTVILIDDVRTTGSTMNEAIRALKQAGATKIICFALGYHPMRIDTIALTDEENLHCSKAICTRPLVPRVNNKSELFYGCSGWTPEDCIGHTNSDFRKAVLSKLAKFEVKVLEPDEELKSAHIEF